MILGERLLDGDRVDSQDIGLPTVVRDQRGGHRFVSPRIQRSEPGGATRTDGEFQAVDFDIARAACAQALAQQLRRTVLDRARIDQRPQLVIEAKQECLRILRGCGRHSR